MARRSQASNDLRIPEHHGPIIAFYLYL